MKIRIKGNSIRIRCEQGEVKRLSAGERLEEAVEFSPTMRLGYTLAPNADLTVPCATYHAGILLVELPISMTTNWYTSDDISIAYTSENGSESGLKILVEKDFACLDHTDEDQSDNYPNPNKTC